MRKLIIAALALMTAGAHASYELLMVLDRGAGEIRRFDPGTGAGLGTFGDELGGTNFNLVLDQSNGQVIVGNYSTTANGYAAVYNYNTGNYVRDQSFTYGTNYASGNNGLVGSIYEPDPSLIVMHSLTGSYQGFKTATGASFSMVGGTSTTRMFAVDNTSKRLFYGNSSSTLFTGSIALPSSANFFYTGEMAVTTSRLAFASATGSTGTATLWLGDINGSGVPSLRAINVANRYQTAFHCVFGHNDDVFIGATKSNGLAYVARYNFITGAFRGEFATGGSDIGGLTMVVAPEPGSFAVLGLGLIAMMRRRR